MEAKVGDTIKRRRSRTNELWSITEIADEYIRAKSKQRNHKIIIEKRLYYKIWEIIE